MKIITRVILAILAFQILFIAWLNLAKCRDWIDHDASMLYSHTINMWEQKDYVLDHYDEETYLNIDTSCILAMPLYGLTGDIFISYGISNIVFLILTLLVMNDVLKKIVKDMYRYAAMVLYVIPYRIGLVQYTNMLFFECSFYALCIIITLLAIDLFLMSKPNPDDKKGKKKYYLILASYVILTALTAFSRGTFMILVALLPIIFCYALEVILSTEGLKHIDRSKIMLIIVTFVSYAIGMGYGKLIDKIPNTTGYELVYPRDLFENFVHVLWGHFSIFIGLTGPEVLTPAGISQLILTGYAILFIIVLVFNIKHAFSENKYANILRYLTIVYLWNCAILGLTNCSDSKWAFPERYLFPGFVALIISVPVMLTYMENIKRDLLRTCAYITVAALAVFTVGISDVNTILGMEKNLEDVQGIKEVIERAHSEGIDTVFFVNDDNAALIARSFAPDLHVTSIDRLEDGSYCFCTRENYLSAHDRAFYGEANILATTWNEQPEAVFNEYQLSSYQNIGDVEDYHLFIAGSNKFDDMTGFPLDDGRLDKTTDFCHSRGYQIIGDIDLYGYLEATGIDNYVLLSPLLDAPYASCNVTLSYEIGHKTADEEYDAGSAHSVGKFMLLDENSQMITEADIMSDQDLVSVAADAGKPCYVAVWLNNDEKITLSTIDFEVIR